jgi:hypothetical protein
MQTDLVDGFRLDRGFQVFQTAYPEAQLALDYSALQLFPLEPGALVRFGGKWVRFSDPWRRPGRAWGTMFNSIGDWKDRWRLMQLRRDVRRQSIDRLLNSVDGSTIGLLRGHYRFSRTFIDAFLRPWFAGIFLESKLATSAAFFRFVFRMLDGGDISYPRLGIQAIPEQLANNLPASSIHLGRKITSRDLSDTDRSQVVIATDRRAAQALIGENEARHTYTGTRCIYFVADRAPIAEPVLLLNGEADGPINHAMIMTHASPDLAPAGRVLISVSSVGDEARLPYDSAAVLSQMRNWFGEQVSEWSELKVYDLPEALPAQPPGFYSPECNSQDSAGSRFQCGDYCETASVNGALRSGRLTAEKVLKSQSIPVNV